MRLIAVKFFNLLTALIYIYIYIYIYNIYIYIILYIYIRGVTVHKIHGSVRYDTVVSRFGMFSIRGAGRNVGNIFVLKNHEGEPMDIKQASICTRVCTRANFVQDLCL